LPDLLFDPAVLYPEAAGILQDASGYYPVPAALQNYKKLEFRCG
jgi:hypothetical protein